MMAAEVHVEPADYDRHRAIGAHSDEKKCRVLYVRLVMHCEKDRKSGDGYKDRKQGESESVFHLVGEECDDHGEDKGACPRRNAVQLGANLSVSVATDDSRRKKRIATLRLA